MSILGMLSVEDQPTVTLIRWRVLRLKVKKMSIDLVLGWCLEDGHARMSAPIRQHDAKARTLTTKSGRVYVLEGASDYDDDAQHILEEHFGRAANKAINVSSEYFNDSSIAEPTNQQSSGQMISPNTVVSLSNLETRFFVDEMDKPLQPNEKLTKAIKKIEGSNE